MKEKQLNGNIHFLLDSVAEVMQKGDVSIGQLITELGRYLHQDQIPVSRTVQNWFSVERRERRKDCHLPSGEYAIALMKWLTDSVAP